MQQLVQLCNILTENNYPSWRREARFALIQLEYWPAIEEPDSLTDKQKKSGIEEKAKGFLYKHVSEQHQHLIDDEHSAKQAWEAIEAAFRGASKARQIQVKRAFHALTLEKSESLAAYFSRANRLREELIAAGRKVDVDDYKMQLLAGLPEPYDAAIEVVSNFVDDDTKTVGDLLARLQDTEMRLSKSKEHGADGAFSRALLTSGPGQHPKLRPKCANCGRIGHKTEYCRQDKYPPCEFCGRTNHNVDKCFLRLDAERKMANARMARARAQALAAKAFVAADKGNHTIPA